MRITLNGYVTSNDNARIYRYYGYEVCCPKDVREGIANCPEGEELILELNSGGGSVYAGFEMYTLIRAHKGRTVAEVQSMAGSAMSVVMAACDEVLISPVANVMIHRSATIAWGNSRVMKETKQMLDTIDESILKAYVEKVGDKTSGEELAKLMRSETFLTAERAIELGFTSLWVLGSFILDLRKGTGFRVLSFPSQKPACQLLKRCLVHPGQALLRFDLLMG